MFPPESEISLPGLANEMQKLKVELFGNTYNKFVLLWRPKREWFKHRRILVSAI
jgi:hypothetical protein